MVDTITLFSGFNTENDLLPADTAKDLYQIIRSLKDRIISSSNDLKQYIPLIENHTTDYNNPHHLTSIYGIKDSLLNTIYLYYKTYYNVDDDTLAYDLKGLTDLFNRDPISMLECLRRIQLNGYKWTDGVTPSNSSPALLKNYFSNSTDVRGDGAFGYSDTPTYSFSRQLCPREFPYLQGLDQFTDTTTTINLPNLQAYFMYGQNQETTFSGSAYGIPFGNKSMLTSDMFFMSWDENYIGDLNNSNGIWSLAVTPHNKVIFIRPFYQYGQYGIIVKVGDLPNNTFVPDMTNAKTFVYGSDVPACALTFNNNPIGYLTTLRDRKVVTETIDYPFSYVGNYTTGKFYSSTLIDPDVIPMSVVDPNRNGYADTNFTPSGSLSVKMMTLELSRFTIQTAVGGYVPNPEYIAERFAQL